MNVKQQAARVFGRRAAMVLTYYNSFATGQSKPVRRVLRALSSVVAAFHVRDKLIPNIEMDMTSRCTLNCKECSHLIPLHREAGMFRDYDVAELLENIDLLLPMIDGCLRFRLLGGEPMMHKQLHVVIDRLVREKKIRHIQIVSNGTILPGEEVLRAMRNKKVSVSISNYGDIVPQRDKVVEGLRAHGVRVLLEPYEPKWRSIGGFEDRGYSPEERKDVFRRCRVLECKSLNAGRIYLCPRAFHAMKLGKVPVNPNEFIDLRACTRDEFWTKLERLYEDPTGLTTCQHCSGGDFVSAPEVPCAEQAPIPQKPNGDNRTGE